LTLKKNGNLSAEEVPEGSLSRAKAASVVIGLPNFGTTCWLNSVIQTLRFRSDLHLFFNQPFASPEFPVGSADL
jgi:ubiquitin C-terminal hydrolase